MIVHTKGIVLRKYLFRESSLIVVFYTESRGKMKAVCKGVRQLKSKKSSHYDPPSLLGLTIYDKEGRELQLVSDSELLDYYGHIKNSLDLFLYASYVLELVEKLTQGQMQNRVVFQLLTTYFATIRKDNAKPLTAGFLLKFLKVTGLFPNLLECCGCGQKITCIAHFNYKQHGVICDNAACLEGNSWDDSLTGEEVHNIYRMIKYTFQEIHEIGFNSQESFKWLLMMNRYVQFITHTHLKALHVIQEVDEHKNPLTINQHSSVQLGQKS